jgi:hypothetical protein
MLTTLTVSNTYKQQRKHEFYCSQIDIDSTLPCPMNNFLHTSHIQ